MNKYVFITPGIGNMGGAQKYLENKVRYLQSKGWGVFVFFYLEPKEVKLPLLADFKDSYIPELLYWYYSFTPKDRKGIINRIKETVGDGDKIIVESHLLSLSYWSELVAKDLGACHIVNFLEEGSYVFSNKQYEFFEYKLKRWQILNAEEANIHRLFGSYFKSDFLQYENKIRFDCSNVVDEYTDVEYDFEKSDYTIITIGRLEKPYVMPMVEEIRNFALKYSSKSINVIFVGGSPDENIEKNIKAKLNLPQLNVYMLGYLYPIPISLLRNVDAAVGSANAVLVTSAYDIPTVSMDMYDSMAIGVYGYTTSNKWARTEEPQQHVSYLLEEILIERKYQPRGEIKHIKEDMEEELARQISFIDRAMQSKGYFDVDSIPSSLERLCAFLKRQVHRWLRYM